MRFHPNKKVTDKEMDELLKMSDWVREYFWRLQYVIAPLLVLSLITMVAGIVLLYEGIMWAGGIMSVITQVAYWSMNLLYKRKKKRAAQILGVPEDWRIE